MFQRPLRLLLISGLIGTTGIATATARNGVRQSIVRPSVVRLPAPVPRPAGPRRALPIALWPYMPLIETMPVPTAPVADEATAPYVIFISGQPPTASQPSAPSDAGYPPGCHAILYGYHCDTVHTPDAR
jgi:hypothetical protein